MSKSLEALDTLVNWGARYEPKSEYYYDLVKKDLEVLEILKSKIGLNYIPIQFDIKQEKHILTGAEITKEEYEKIKEWLENERTNK